MEPEHWGRRLVGSAHWIGGTKSPTAGLHHCVDDLGEGVRADREFAQSYGLQILFKTKELPAEHLYSYDLIGDGGREIYAWLEQHRNSRNFALNNILIFPAKSGFINLELVKILPDTCRC